MKASEFITEGWFTREEKKDKYKTIVDNLMIFVDDTSGHLPFGTRSFSVGGKNMGQVPSKNKNGLLHELGADSYIGADTIKYPSTNVMMGALGDFIRNNTSGGYSKGTPFEQDDAIKLAKIIYDWDMEMISHDVKARPK